MISISVQALHRKQATRRPGPRHHFTVVEPGRDPRRLPAGAQVSPARSVAHVKFARSDMVVQRLGGEDRRERIRLYGVFQGQRKNLLPGSTPKHRIESSLVSALQRSRPQVIDQILDVLRERMEEAGGSPLDSDSLNSAAHFLVRNSDLVDPNLRLTDDGNLVLGWTLEPDGLLILLFRPDNTVIYSGGVGRGRLSSGTVHRDDLRQNLRQFEEWLTTS